MPYPTGAAAVPLLAKAGVVATAEDLDPLARAAKAWWERETGWKPFVGRQSVDTYDPPGSKQGLPYREMGGSNLLPLRKGLLTVNSLTVRGQPRVLGRDFAMVKGAEGWPCELLRFPVPLSGPPDSVVINGVWGFCLDDEDDDDLAAVYLALAYKAAGDYLTDHLQRQAATGISQLKRGDDSVSFDLKTLTASAAAWETRATKVLAPYRRITSTL